MFINGAKFLVTGGCGFIGSDFLRRFVLEYPSVTFVNLDALTYAANTESVALIQECDNYIFIHGDICDKDFVDKLFLKYKFDVVINFAAQTHVDNSISGPEIFLDSNIYGTFSLLEACKKYGIKRFHQISTDEVYGDLPINRPELMFKETDNLNPSSPYSVSKASADMLVLSYYRTYNINVTISRCSNNYGEFQNKEKFIPTIIKNANKNRKIPVYGNGRNIRDWIYVGDHNMGIKRILQRGVSGEVYNLGSNNEWSNIEIVKLILYLRDKSHDLIEFVEDRPGHDQRYAIDSTKAFEQLGFKNKYGHDNFIEKLTKVIDFYLDFGC